jgi:nucleoside-diphosphate-sugar epimerase
VAAFSTCKKETFVNILITGGTGNLARHCHDDLREHGHQVTLFDRFRSSEAARPWSTDSPIVVGDLTSRDDCLRAVESARAEAIVHLGGIAYASDVPSSQQSAMQAGQHPVPADATFRVNTLGTYYILDAARQVGTRTVVLASTASVLLETRSVDGWLQKLPIDEGHELRPTNSYSMSKLLNEETLWLFSRDCGIRCVAFRMVWVYMPHHEDGWSWNPQLPQSPSVPGPGQLPLWQYLDARDAATAYRLAIEADRPEVSGPMYLATDRSCAEEHRELIARYFPQFQEQAERMEPDDLAISISRAREVLGYVPRQSWRGPDVGERIR